MSIYVSSLVWQCPDLEDKSELLVMLALADFADDDGGNVYPSKSRLAFKARQSVRNIRYVLEKLESKKYITITLGGGPNSVNLVRINLEILRGVQPLHGCKTEHGGVQNETLRGAKLLHPIHQETSKNRQTLSSAPLASEVELLDFAAPDQTPAITPEKPKKEKKPRAVFVAPTLEEVTEHWLGMEYPGGADEAEHFFDKHTAKGWRIGSSPMKDWKAACRTWVRYVKQNRFGNPNNSHAKNFRPRPTNGGNVSAESFARTAARHGFNPRGDIPS